MVTTEVIYTDAKYNRSAYLDINDDEVVFDCSDGEYGPIVFSLELLKQKIKEHEKNLAH